MRLAGLVVVLTLAACAPPAPTMTEAEAFASLQRFARGASDADVCVPEGRAELRDAVRSYSAAQREAGRPWPSIASLQGQGELSVTDVDVYVLGALAIGFVEPGDMPGSIATMAHRIESGYRREISDMREAVRVACPEIVALQETMARYTIEIDRYTEQMERMQERGGDRDRMMRMATRLERARRDIERLTAAVEAKLAEAKAS